LLTIVGKKEGNQHSIQAVQQSILTTMLGCLGCHHHRSRHLPDSRSPP